MYRGGVAAQPRDELGVTTRDGHGSVDADVREGDRAPGPLRGSAECWEWSPSPSGRVSTCPHPAAHGAGKVWRGTR